MNRKRKVGHESAEAAIGAKNAKHITQIIRIVVKRYGEITADDVRDELAPTTKHALKLHPSALPALLTRACIAQILRKTNRTEPSRRESRRGAAIAVYAKGRAA